MVEFGVVLQQLVLGVAFVWGGVVGATPAVEFGVVSQQLVLDVALVWGGGVRATPVVEFGLVSEQFALGGVFSGAGESCSSYIHV